MTRNFSIQDSRSNKIVFTAENFIIAAVSLSLFGGRWISYIGLPDYNLYLIDFLYFFGVAGIMLFQKNSFASKNTFMVTLLLIVFISFQLSRNLDYDLVKRLRDLVPFLYLVTTAVIIKKFPTNAWVRAIKFVRFATVFGAIWTDLVMVGLLNELFAPQQFAGVPIFSARWDHSGISMCIGLLLWGSFPGARLKENVPIRLFLLISVLLQYSRASYLGLFLVLISIYFATKRKRKLTSLQMPGFLKICSILFVVGIPSLTLLSPIIPQNSALNRIGIENIFSPSKLIQDTRDSGTANARIEAQKLLTSWLYENGLEFLGAGPGREMLLESNAHRYLSGARDVRSPHSWFYGNFGRFGFMGLILWHFVCISYLRAQKSRLRLSDFPTNILIVIYVIALFGVIIESPFGILPFSFFLGGSKLLDLSNE